MSESDQNNKNQNESVFELGLVMAGAISAGAYTAGVIDFLLQALDEWQQLKHDKPDECPRHEVKIRVMSGASAGGMTSAITTAMLNGNFSPMDTLPKVKAGPKNPLYESWVERIDIRPLLGKDDLRDNKPVVSLLDSTILNGIANEAISFNPIGKLRPYISDELHLFLTLSNLRGVPYHINFQGQSGSGHDIVMHADYLHFVSGAAPVNTDDWGRLDRANPVHENWQRLKTAALATGAFPVGLAPRLLTRQSDDYNKLAWEVPHQDPVTGSINYENRTITPNWPAEFGTSFGYDYVSVDGGLMNNEPLELARRNLARGAFCNPRTPDKVNRAVLMIDPFPNEDPVTKEDVCKYRNYDIVNVITEMFTSLKHQARFKPEELILAQDDSVYSRWLIAPVRCEANSATPSPYPIASGMFGGFGGFLSNKFRRHDFQLGRRNCQKFLRDLFVIPLDDARMNPVFAACYTPDDFIKYSVPIKGQQCLQIIPVSRLSCKAEVLPLPWEKMTKDELEEICNLVESRTDAVLDRLVDKKLEGNFLGQVGLNLILTLFAKGKITKAINAKIEEELIKYELLS